MDTIKIQRDQIKMVAHRGLSGIERENTVAAFIAAANRSYWGIETDVHVTADGEFIVIHDATTGRVADVDINVEQSALEQVKQVRILDVTGGEMAARDDLRIPMLSDYIDICHKYGKIAVLELKQVFDEASLARMVEQIRKQDHLEKTVFISFHYQNLVILRRLLPKQPVQFLTSKPLEPEQIAQMLELEMDLDISHKLVTPELVAQFHSHGRVVNCWTVDSPEVYGKMKECGVDQVTSNILE